MMTAIRKPCERRAYLKRSSFEKSYPAAWPGVGTSTHICAYVYKYGHPPPPLRQTLELHFQSVQEGGGRPTLQNSSSFQKSKNPKNPTQVSEFLETRAGASKSKNRAKSSSFQNSKTQKLQPKFRIFGNSSGSLKIQKSSKFLDFPKFQKSKNSNPSFGFLETRAGASKSKKRANSSTFQNSKNPKTPTQVSDFWKLEREPQNPKIEQIPRVSKIPNLGVIFLDFWNFGNSRNLLDFWIWRLPLEFPKFQKSKNSNPSFGFLETRAGASKSKNRANSSSFQNSKPWGDFFGFLQFWKLEEFARFLDLEAPARVSKIPKFQKLQPKFRIFGNSNGSLKIQKSSKFLEFPKFQTLGWFFLGFWNFGNSRNLLDFWILRLPFEFPKIQTFGVDFWIFGILETGVWIRFFQGFLYDSLL